MRFKGRKYRIQQVLYAGNVDTVQLFQKWKNKKNTCRNVFTVFNRLTGGGSIIILKLCNA